MRGANFLQGALIWYNGISFANHGGEWFIGNTSAELNDLYAIYSAATTKAAAPLIRVTVGNYDGIKRPSLKGGGIVEYSTDGGSTWIQAIDTRNTKAWWTNRIPLYVGFEPMTGAIMIDDIVVENDYITLFHENSDSGTIDRDVWYVSVDTGTPDAITHYALKQNWE